MTEICGVSITNSWLGGFLFFAGLLLTGMVLLAVAEWPRDADPGAATRGAERWRTRAEREVDEEELE